MFTRCVFCHADLPANDSIERFPYGRKIAFDSGRGRLWAVCDACRRWNLAPIEDRWEALDELEKTVSDRGRLLSHTDNISLIRAGQLDIVRVGHATKLVEEAWWRYGKELKERHSRSKKHSYIEAGAMIALSAATGGTFWLFSGDTLNSFMRWRQFGSTAWRGAEECPVCGHMITELKFKESKRLVIAPHHDDEVSIELVCSNCRSGERGRARIEGMGAQHALRRMLAWHHYSGASERRVREATQIIENAGSAQQLARHVAQRSLRLDRLKKKENRAEAIALEIALNDDAERRLLELELEDLEARWREEEEIAAIVDGELTPLPALEKLRRMLSPDPRIVRPGAGHGDVG